MRLSSHEKTAIRTTVSQFDADATIFLFGSRTDDACKGGDIDLLILSSKLDTLDVTKIRISLFDQIGEQKIDIILAKSTNESSFVKHAYETGIKL